MSAKILAEILLVIHLIWIAFMLYGFVLTVRAFWRPAFWDRWIFRTTHLAGILFVAAMPLLGLLCPLTEWEYQLRSHFQAGSGQSGSFIIDWLEKLVYPDVPLAVVLVPTFVIAMFTLTMYVVRPPHKVRELFRVRK
jgi:hypothetical protein